MYQQLIAGDVLGSVLEALTQDHYREVHMDLIGIVRDIYVELFEETDTVGNVMLELPNMTEEILEDLNRQLEKSGKEKKQRSAIRAVLKDIIGMNIVTNLYTKPVNILNLPEKLFVQKAEDVANENERLTDAALKDVGSLFDQ
eukprot:TRINITY_DN4722_c0_g1_i1.p3 TRINITY_DN4722_c0_g1~~TRINITY_DN4722_c0_g1_i1.p3  ORF type:complete len:143 (-),score=67.48 TRINITY_DN4722_c0_g1_i1:51-479(-)